MQRVLAEDISGIAIEITYHGMSSYWPLLSQARSFCFCHFKSGWCGNWNPYRHCDARPCGEWDQPESLSTPRHKSQNPYWHHDAEAMWQIASLPYPGDKAVGGFSMVLWKYEPK